ncbi:MAG: FG-GAP-like repeat-containing protein [Planctomycetota bacterium]|jgi:hypothetical protein
MENTCEKIQEQIPELITGTLSAKKISELQSHINQCPTCSKYLEALQADDKMLGEYVEAMQPAVTQLEKDAMDALDDSMSHKGIAFSSIWRTIMKSRITKFTTAAAIILAVIISVKSIDGKTAWAQVIKAFNQADDIHVVKTERSSNGRIIRESESWVKNQTLFRAESQNWCVINDGRKILSLYKDHQIADLRETVTPYWDYTPLILKVFRGDKPTNGTTITMLANESTEKLNVYEISFRDYWRGKAWIDNTSSLPVRIVGREKEDGEQTREFEIKFRYEPILAEVFDTSIPRGFNELPRIANRPHSEENEVLFGKVIDEKGNPVAGAQVYASYAHHGMTDKNGEFALPVDPDDGSNSLGPADFPMFVRAFRTDETQRVAWTIIRHPASRDLDFRGMNSLNFRERATDRGMMREDMSEATVVEQTYHGVKLVVENEDGLSRGIPGDPGELFGDIDDEPKVRNITLVMGPASTLAGRITKTSGEPIANAKVWVEDMQQSIGTNIISISNLGGEWQDKAFAITDNGGYYELNNLPASWDKVYINVMADGYRTDEQQLARDERTVVERCDFELVAGEPDDGLERANRYFGNILSASAVRTSQEFQEVAADGYPVKGGNDSIAEVAPPGLTEGLILYYSFYTDSDPATVVDISGKNNHGQVNGAKYISDEVLGGAMSFDGQGDFVSVPNVLFKEFTFSAWVKTLTSNINNRRIFTLSDGEQCYGLQGNVGGGVGVYVSDNVEINEYNWHLGKYMWTHITVTHDGRRFAIYKNGRLTEAGNIETNGVTGMLYIGGTSSHRGDFWYGMIDEVAIFNRALTDGEVKQLYSMTGEIVEAETMAGRSNTSSAESKPSVVNSASSTKHTITTDYTGGIVYPSDLDGDGDLDVVGTAEGHNRRISISTRSGILLSSRVRPEILSNSGEGGDPGGIYWWENTDGRATSWAKHTVDANVTDIRNAFPVDVDRDGDVDMIGSASGDELAWWENSSSDGSLWGKHTIDGSVGGAQLVYAADVDNDSDTDVVGATWLDGGIYWWENTGGNGASWRKHTIDGAMNADYCRTHCMHIADMDGDGRMDVVASAGRESGINWWENPKAPDATWIRHYIVGSDGEVESVYPANLDGDSDMDLIGSIRRHDGLTWWENTKGNATEWTKHILDSSYHSEQQIDAADMDSDGDVDILGAVQRINTIVWWKNKKGDATEWVKHIMSRDFGNAGYTYAVDIDGNGSQDMLCVGGDNKEIAWFESRPNSD